MITTDIIKREREKIIDQMYQELEATPEGERFFSSDNVKDCQIDLDHYLDLLAHSHQSKDQQKEISKSIKWIFKALSTFKGEEEEPEFLWGFIYNGYTEQLTNFILQSAFTFGLQKGKVKTIKSKVFNLTHHPHSLDVFHIYVGSTGSSSIVLNLNHRTGHFEYIENFYGDGYGLPIFNLKCSEDFSELSFEVLTSGAYKAIILKAQNRIDNILYKAIQTLHQGNLFKHQPKPDFCKIELELNEGVLTNLGTLNYDEHNRIISMFTKGTGLKAFMQEFDITGKFQNSDNLESHAEIVGKKFIAIDAVPNWKYYEIDDLSIKDNTVFITTTDREFQYKDEKRSDIVAAQINPKTLRYEIKTYDFMKELLNDLLPLRKPLKEKS
jgi:hypothetical protein